MNRLHKQLLIAFWLLTVGCAIIGITLWHNIAYETFSYQHQQVIVADKPSTVVAIPKSQVNYNVMAELINSKRSQAGVRPALMVNDKLNQSAQMKANDMAANDYWAHNSPSGTTPWHWFDVAGYKYTKAGENLAKCYNTEQAAVEAWFASPEHKANMLGDYNQIGFGTATMKDGCFLIVNHFGKAQK